MIDINIYRQRIGCFHPNRINKLKKCAYDSHKVFVNRKMGFYRRSLGVCLWILILYSICSLDLVSHSQEVLNISQQRRHFIEVVHFDKASYILAKSMRIFDSNYQARYLYGNILNVRSL